MPDFDSGVASYVHATATIDIHFPVDGRGVAHITCEQCYYFRQNYRTCGLNGKVCAFPNRYVGAGCPLKINTMEDKHERDREV